MDRRLVAAALATLALAAGCAHGPGRPEQPHATRGTEPRARAAARRIRTSGPRPLPPSRPGGSRRNTSGSRAGAGPSSSTSSDHSSREAPPASRRRCYNQAAHRGQATLTTDARAAQRERAPAAQRRLSVTNQMPFKPVRSL